MSKKISISKIQDIDDVDFELNISPADVDRTKPVTRHNKHYINGKELLEEFTKYYEIKQKCLAEGLDIPPLTNKIGAAIIQIATRRCNSWQYVRYSQSWKEEMIANAIMLATIHGHNFNPEKSKNVFAYITTICDNAIKEQIKREKRQLYIRYKQFDNLGGFQAEGSDDGEDVDYGSDGASLDGGQENIDIGYEERLQYISDYEERTINKPKVRRVNPEIVELDV